MSELPRAIQLRDDLTDRYANCDAARIQDWNHMRVLLEALTTACEMVADLERQLAERKGELTELAESVVKLTHTGDARDMSPDSAFWILFDEICAKALETLKTKDKT